MLNLLIGPIADLAGTWLNGKVEKSKAETGAKVARAKAEATIMERKLRANLLGIWKWLKALPHRGKTSGLQFCSASLSYLRSFRVWKK